MWHGGKWIRPEKRLAIYIRDRFECVYCGADLRTYDPNSVTLDHLLPRSKGGTNLSDNLITACKPCNSSRKDRPWMEYATGGAIDRIDRQRWLSLNMSLARAIMDGTAGDEELEALR